MSTLTKIIIAVYILLTNAAQAQTIIRGKVIDAISNEPIAGATIQSEVNKKTGFISLNNGYFELNIEDTSVTYLVSFVGYETKSVRFNHSNQYIIALTPSHVALQELVVTANREGVKRSQAPVAISSINTKMLNDAKATSIDQLLNKVSGVYMVNLGNEQHSMSIRQPMTTKSLFLYLEDGIPVRTTGLFNHNALLEINMAAVKSIEVIKGPSSSLYGSEAIGGVVNFISTTPSSNPVAKFSVQANNIGYKRADLQTSFTTGKWGVAVSGYYVNKKNGFIEYSDFHKGTFTTRIDYSFNKKTSLSNSLTWLNYYSDMNGSIDSAKYASKTFFSPQTFTYRKVNALRYRSTLMHVWNENHKTNISIVYRKNSIGQNPAYSIRDDYRRQSSGKWTGIKELAHGEINESAFNSYAIIAQHRQKINWKKAIVIAGVSSDISPSDYKAQYIRIKKDTVSGKYVQYQNKDSVLTSYKTNINNYAAYFNAEFSPFEKLRVVASLRYDVFRYKFDNHLQPSAFSGSPDTISTFSAISPKIGFTYNFSNKTGVYANYSQGFVPPQVTEMYKGVKVPDIKSSVFYNYEIGGWIEIIKNKLMVDLSAYQLEGTNEIIAVRLEDGTSENRNAGKTMHKGIEIGIKAMPLKDVSLHINGAYSEHRFTKFVEKGNNYNGNTMNGAPKWMHNAEVWYKPSFIKGLRFGVEWQHVGKYYLDPKNTEQYKGHHVFHMRAGYKWKGIEVWMNVMNTTDKYYSYTASKSSSGYSYTPAEPRNYNVGVAYDLGSVFKR